MHADFQYKKRSNGTPAILFFTTILVLFIIVLDVMTGGKIQSLVQSAVSPLWRLGADVSGGIERSGFFSTRASLEAQIATLQQELAQEQLDAAAFGVVQQENTALSQMTHLAQTSPGITAPIVSSLDSSPYGTFWIGAGSKDGVAQGSSVLVADPQGTEGFVIGVVSHVESHTSLVQELFAPGSSIDVVIDGASVSAQGRGGENASAEVAHGIAVSVGDPVIAPNYGGRAVGIVGHVTSDPASAQSQVYIGLPVSFSSLRFVYVTP